MLGKRARSMHRTVSISHLDPGSDPQKCLQNPQSPVVRIVGFNLASNNAERSLLPEQFNPFSTTPKCMQFSVDRGETSGAQAIRSPVCRGSALRSLLSSTRPVVELKETSVYSSFQRQFHVVPDKQLCLEADEGHAAVDVVSKEAKGSRELAGSHHFLYLATSPLFDIPTLTPTINFLDACYLCKRPLGNGLDIFMYRGDTAFCSVECRYQQILMDEHKEKSALSRLGLEQLFHLTRWTAVAGGR